MGLLQVAVSNPSASRLSCRLVDIRAQRVPRGEPPVALLTGARHARPRATRDRGGRVLSGEGAGDGGSQLSNHGLRRLEWRPCLFACLRGRVQARERDVLECRSEYVFAVCKLHPRGQLGSGVEVS